MGVGLGATVGVGVAIAVAVGIGVDVGVLVGVAVGVLVGVFVTVGRTVDSPSMATNPAPLRLHWPAVSEARHVLPTMLLCVPALIAMSRVRIVAAAKT